MTLRLRANILVAVLMAGCMAALGVVALDIIRLSIREEIEAATSVASQTIGASAQLNGNQVQRMLPHLRALGRVRANDLIVVGMDGRDIYHAPQSEYKKNRNAPAWFSRLVDPELASVRFELKDGSIQVIPDASRAVMDAWDDAQNFALIALTFLTGIHGAVYWLVGHTLRPLDKILEGLTEMEHSNYDVRLPRFALPEFARVSDLFNRLAMSLAKVRRLERDQQVAALVRVRLEDERRRFARELHDELSQCITAIQTIAVAIHTQAKGASPEVTMNARNIASVAERMHDEVHQMIARLREAEDVAPEQIPPICALIEMWQMRHPEIEVSCQIDQGDVEKLENEASLTTFRVVQEALTNVARHSGASKVGISVCRRDGSDFEIVVEDDGRGIRKTDVEKPNGYGVVGMRERVHAVGGQLHFESVQGNGTKVIAILPFDSEVQ